MSKKFEKYLNEELDKGDLTEAYKFIEKGYKIMRSVYKDASKSKDKNNIEAVEEILENINEALETFSKIKA